MPEYMKFRFFDFATTIYFCYLPPSKIKFPNYFFKFFFLQASFLFYLTNLTLRIFVFYLQYMSLLYPRLLPILFFLSPIFVRVKVLIIFVSALRLLFWVAASAGPFLFHSPIRANTYCRCWSRTLPDTHPHQQSYLLFG